MLPSSTEISYFLEVAKSENLSRASERLGVTQPTLSLALKRLEETIGVQLLIRSKTGVKLTHSGKRFRAEAKNLLQNWERLKAETLKEKSVVQGSYSIGCHPSVALYSLKHFLPKLLTENKQLDISLKHALSRKITERVVSFQLDFGIVVNPVQHPDLVITKLYEDVVTLWTSKNNKNKDTLILDPGLLQSQDLLKKIKKQKMSFDRHLTTSNLEIICSLVQSGCGVGILPTSVAKNSGFSFSHFKKSQPLFKDQICFVYRQDSQKGLASRTIIDSILKSLKK